MSVFISDNTDSHHPILRKTRKKYYTKYNLKYKAEYPWALPSSKGELFAFCNLCYVDISIKSVGAKGLRDHEATCRHSQKVHEINGGSLAEATSIHQHEACFSAVDIQISDSHSVPVMQNISAPVALHSSFSCAASPIAVGKAPNCKDRQAVPVPSEMIHSTHLMPSHSQPLSSTGTSYQVLETGEQKILAYSNVPQDPSVMNSCPSTLSHDNLPRKLSHLHSNGLQSVNDYVTAEQLDVNLVAIEDTLNGRSVQQNTDLPSTGIQNCSTEDCGKEKTGPNLPPGPLLDENIASAEDLTCSICGKLFSNWKQLKMDLMQHIEAATLQKLATQNYVEKETKKKKKREIKRTKETLETVSKVESKRGRPSRKNKTYSADSTQHLASAKTQLNSQRLQNTSEYMVASIKAPQTPEIAMKLRKRGRPLKNTSGIESCISSKNQRMMGFENVHETPKQQALNEPQEARQDRVKKISPNRRCSQLQCRVCKSIFYLRQELKSHYEKEHNNGRPYSCEICGKSFTTKNNLQVHKKHKHVKGPNPCLCNNCGKILSSRTNLKIHIMIHKGEKPFCCPVCSKCFSRKANMEMHMVYHTGERRFTCEICGQSFFAINALKRHKKLHSGEREYRCHVCDATYVTGTDLRRHLLKHEAVKPFPCNLCEKQFTRSHDLKVHLRYHNKEIRFTCKVCGKQFVESGNYRRHLRRHTGERPYSCAMCGQSFSQVHHYKVHVRTSHPDEDPKEKDVTSQDHYSSHQNQLANAKIMSSSKIVHNISPNSQDGSVYTNQQASNITPVSAIDNSQADLLQNIHESHICITNAAESVQKNSSTSVLGSIAPVSNVNGNISDVHNHHAATVAPHAAHLPMLASHHTQFTQSAISHPSSWFLQYNSYVYNNGVISPYQQLDMCPQ